MVKLLGNKTKEYGNNPKLKFPKLTVSYFKTYLTSMYKNSALISFGDFVNRYPLDEIKEVAKKLPKNLKKDAETLIANYENDNISNNTKKKEILFDSNLASDQVNLRRTLFEAKKAAKSTNSKIKILEEDIIYLQNKLNEQIHKLEAAKKEKDELESKIECMTELRTIDLVWDLEYILEDYFSEKYFLYSYIRISEINDDSVYWVQDIWNDFPNIIIKDKIVAISKVIAYCSKLSQKENIRIYCPADVIEVIQKYIPEFKEENFITN